MYKRQCGKPLSSSLSARPANTSRNGVISGKWQKKDVYKRQVRKQIGKTTYIVRVHFSQTAKETMEDKIKRLLREEVRKM